MRLIDEPVVIGIYHGVRGSKGIFGRATVHRREAETVNKDSLDKE